ncbi:MAG: nitroreductase family protein [Nitrosopumilus sp.]|nr:nitroreductase family protein [Nitrosopumilus sp.]MDH3385636.1 nitroreductase family protein [Nitrosopumilus sp.]
MDKKEDMVYPSGYEPPKGKDNSMETRKSLLHVILGDHSKEISEDLDTDLFEVMKRRRSTRKFETKPVENWKVEKILAAADTAPTAGNFQGFEIFHIKNKEMKEKLVEAANNQPYVNAPLVLVYCKNPSRVKLKFPKRMLTKFAIQDATLAAAYSQLAATALSLSTIWIGMIDEKKVAEIIGTDLEPSSILCIGYPVKRKFPKPRRNLSDLIHVME